MVGSFVSSALAPQRTRLRQANTPPDERRRIAGRDCMEGPITEAATRVVRQLPCGPPRQHAEIEYREASRIMKKRLEGVASLLPH